MDGPVRFLSTWTHFRGLYSDEFTSRLKCQLSLFFCVLCPKLTLDAFFTSCKHI